VGIAHGYTLGDRFEGRYVGRSHDCEMNLATAYGTRFATLPDDYSPRRKVDPAKYSKANIPVPSQNSKSRYRRLTRAERYAKIGVGNIWFSLIDATSNPTKERLAKMEKQLIKASNAMLFDLKSEGQSSGWPLVNVVHARSETNPYLHASDQQSYAEWINGHWP
jgi:hypothetical protein